jgi:putative Holliday junction resolvase
VITTGTAQFRDALPDGGRLMGLDVGTKTIGVALCDAGWTIASPAELIMRGKFSADFGRLKSMASAQRAAGIVVGLPLNLDGSESPRTQSTRAFARNLEQAGLPDPAVGRALVDPGGDANPARRGRKPRPARRARRQDGRRLHPPGRDRRAHHGLVADYATLEFGFTHL